jgi:hypothetical protein
MRWINICDKDGRKRMPTYDECKVGIVVLWKDGRIGCVHYVPSADFWNYGYAPDYWAPLPKTEIDWHNTVL